MKNQDGAMCNQGVYNGFKIRFADSNDTHKIRRRGSIDDTAKRKKKY